MAIETLDDIIDALADKLYIYGAHDDTCTEKRPCRVCWTADLRNHLVAAIEIEEKLYPAARASVDRGAPDEREKFEAWDVESRRLNPNCGCEHRGGRLFRCCYHEGAEDAWGDAWEAASRAGAAARVLESQREKEKS